MKYLLIGTALVAAGLGAAWYGGETWLSGMAREAVVNSPVVEAARVTPLRDPGRVGLRLAEVDIGDARNGLSAPGLDVYAPLTALTTMTVSLPAQMQLRIDGAPVALSLQQGRAQATISPTREMAVRDAAVTARGVMVDGVEMLKSLDVTADLTHMGAAAPPGSRAAYAMTVAATGATLAGLPERLDIAGPVQLWLTEVPGQPMLEGRVPPPAPTAIQTRGLRFTLGESEATLIGRLQADAQGFAEGEAAFYTADARQFVDAAVRAGLVPQNAAMLVGALIDNLAATPIPSQTEAAAPAASPADTDAGADIDSAPPLPPAPEGQIRLPLILKGGEVRLGPVAIGPAPRMIAAP
ncbi:DUF2125 domain-containing protein [Paracoccus sp. S1E-3]|uniref:DUF2125 domain-containing protein n=1 Tax=Paracoccus sp. S1E-3 TaxID=2756130 RepID=UPI0015EEC357|nr:DUF2125 domain-containing protein [Paracoccus sp. S1E-3]MBA4489745.1 DUF2125 domain-containing protein [Paracoccus sp. S1E-3]